MAIPPGARIIDGTGKMVTPGFIDSQSRIGLWEIEGWAEGTVDATTTEDDLGASFNPVWAVNPENTYIPIARLRGVTSAVLVPGGDQIFTGQGALIALDEEALDAMIRRESSAIYTAMGEVGSGRAGGSRAANYQRLQDALWDVRAGILAGDQGGEDDSDDPDEEGGRSELNARNKKALEAVFSGDVPLVIAANRMSDLHLALRLKSEFDIDMVIAGGAEAWRMADELRAASVPVIVNPTTNLPTFDGLSASLDNAGVLAAAGVQVLLTAGCGSPAEWQCGGGRALPHMAGLAVANGMDHGAALQALTLGPATVWGVAGEMGSLEPNKVADVVVWSGDPFELSTSAEHVFIGGREIPDDSRQERLFERYRDLSRYRLIGG